MAFERYTAFASPRRAQPSPAKGMNVTVAQRSQGGCVNRSMEAKRRIYTYAQVTDVYLRFYEFCRGRVVAVVVAVVW